MPASTVYSGVSKSHKAAERPAGDRRLRDPDVRADRQGVRREASDPRPRARRPRLRSSSRDVDRRPEGVRARHGRDPPVGRRPNLVGDRRDEVGVRESAHNRGRGGGARARPGRAGRRSWRRPRGRWPSKVQDETWPRTCQAARRGARQEAGRGARLRRSMVAPGAHADRPSHDAGRIVRPMPPVDRFRPAEGLRAVESCIPRHKVTGGGLDPVCRRSGCAPQTTTTDRWWGRAQNGLEGSPRSAPSGRPAHGGGERVGPFRLDSAAGERRCRFGVVDFGGGRSSSL